MIPRAAGLMLVASLAWLCRSPVKDRRNPRLFLELALVLLAMLLLSERTWKHHLVTFPIIFLASWQVLACYPWSDRFRLCFVVGLIVQFILLVVVRSKTAMFGGVITLGMLLCFIQIAILLRRLKLAPT